MKDCHKRRGAFGQNWRSAKARKKSLQRLVDQTSPELERLMRRALSLNDDKASKEVAKESAKELLRRATEILEYLGPVLMDAPHLLADEAMKRFDMPSLIALHRGHRYYYKRVLDRLRELNLGSETGVACRDRANWKSTGNTGALAVTLYNTVKALRTNSTPQADNVTKAFVLYIRKCHPSIATTASGLQEFGADSVDDWIEQGCLPVLYALMPKLQPMKRGRRKQTDKERADPLAKRKRDAIVQRIRDMVSRPNKSRNY
jgi:hypothetical protein